MTQLRLRNVDDVMHRIERLIADTVGRLGRRGCILGLSGGIDSALVAYLAVRAVGAERVKALFLPDRDSNPRSEHDARLVADALGISCQRIDLTAVASTIGAYELMPELQSLSKSQQEAFIHQQLHRTGGRTFGRTRQHDVDDPTMRRYTAYLNVKHRLRAAMIYLHADQENRLVLGGCNKTEKMIGFFVKYGDSASDVDPIAGLFKTHVRQLSQHLGMPEPLLSKAPSPDMGPGLTDEDAIGLPYDLLDVILWGIDQELDDPAIQGISGADLPTITYVRQLVATATPMNELPPTVEVESAPPLSRAA